MPYILRKLPNKDLYRVRLKDTGQILSYATTYENAMKQINFLRMRDKNLKGGSIDDHSNVQSVIFKKEFNTIQQADKWLKEHDYKIDKSTYNFKTTNYLRYRQHDPDADAYDYRLKEIDPKRCIYLVLEYPKE